MKKSRTRTSDGATNARALLFGIVFTAVTFIVLMLLGAVIAGRMENPTSRLGAVAICSLYITAAVSGLVTSKYKGEGGALPAVLSALAFALVLLIIGLIMTGGHIPAITVINLGAYVITALVFAVIGKRRASGRRRR